MLSYTRHLPNAHDDSIFSSAISNVLPTSQHAHLVTGCLDSTIKIWNESNFEMIHCLQGHSLAVISVDIEPRGILCASSGLDNVINIWDAEKGQVVRNSSFKTGDNWTLSFLPDARYIATGSSSGEVKILSVTSGKVESSLSTTDKDFLLCVNFSPNGKYLCCGSSKGYIYIFDMIQGTLMMKNQAHSDSVRSIKISSNSKYLASGSEDNLIMIYDVEAMQKLNTLFGMKTKIWDVAFSLDSSQVAASSVDGVIKVWDLNTFNCIHTYKEANEISSNCWSLNFNNEGKLISTHDDGSLKCFTIHKESIKK
ncbi:MAG: WD repeat-containing protein 61 [Marteilia pararefringens]